MTMMMMTQVLFVLLLLLVVTPRPGYCSSFSSLEQQPQNQPQQRGLDKESTPILARYKNEEGIAALLSFDVDGELDLQIERFRLAAISVAAADTESLDSILEELRSNENIEAVVADFERGIGPPGPVDEPFVDEEDEDGDGRRRRLKRESVEYGIKLVQADQLFDLADEAPARINVCVVDTGIQEGHEDLPTSQVRR
jgi:hypothetical protein